MAMHPTHPLAYTTATLALATLLAGCTTAPAPFPGAIAKLEPTKGNTAQGTVRFMQLGSKVAVTGEISGLKPGAAHGFHVHEKGDCSSGDGMSTGGHFNPLGAPHGNHDKGAHHAGDLPSLQADASGIARFSFESDSITLGGATGIVDRGLVVHRDPDDYSTQPTGNSGPRIACAIITRADLNQ